MLLAVEDEALGRGVGEVDAVNFVEKGKANIKERATRTTGGTIASVVREFGGACPCVRSARSDNTGGTCISPLTEAAARQEDNDSVVYWFAAAAHKTPIIIIAAVRKCKKAWRGSV